MDFYIVDEDYISYLQDYERKHRNGITRVPNVRYADRNKFSFGAVLTINDISYYVAVSSFKTKQEANILIYIPEDKEKIKGSLRFNFMIPIPQKCLKRLVIKDIKDIKYRLLVNKEYNFCMANKERIEKKAKKIYNMVIENKKQKLTDNSCDFILLEKAYKNYFK
jgi:protein AbiQ